MAIHSTHQRIGMRMGVTTRTHDSLGGGEGCENERETIESTGFITN